MWLQSGLEEQVSLRGGPPMVPGFTGAVPGFTGTVLARLGSGRLMRRLVSIGM